MTGLEIAAAVQLGLGVGSQVWDWITTSDEERQAKQYGQTAAALQSKIHANVQRRLAGLPSGPAAELARRAESAGYRQAERARAQVERDAIRRGISGSGIGLAQEREALQYGQRAASGTRRAIELADIRGAESEAMQLTAQYRELQQYNEAKELAREQAWLNLIAGGTRALGLYYGMQGGADGTTGATGAGTLGTKLDKSSRPGTYTPGTYTQPPATPATIPKTIPNRPFAFGGTRQTTQYPRPAGSQRHYWVQ